MLVSRGCADTLPIRFRCPREVLLCESIARIQERTTDDTGSTFRGGVASCVGSPVVPAKASSPW